MSTEQVIQLAESLPPLERLKIIDALSASLKHELSEKPPKSTDKRKRPFKVRAVHLGNVQVDRDEIYAERGL
jgi:hypothetical protein